MTITWSNNTMGLAIMKTPPIRASIDDLGLPHWIDSHRGTQNGYGWKDFDLFCELRVPVAVMGRIFKRSDKTILDWKRRRAVMKGDRG
jgi:hypothetical protein